MARNTRLSVSVSCRIDAVSLGIARRWLVANGKIPASRSELVDMCVRVVAEGAPKTLDLSLTDALWELDYYYPVATRRGTRLLDKRVSASRRAIINANEDAWFDAGLKVRGLEKDSGGQALLRRQPSEEPEGVKQGGEEKKSLNLDEVTRGNNHYLVCGDRETYDEVIKTLGSPELAKQAGYSVLMADEFDYEARRPKSEVKKSVGVPQEVLKSLGDMVVVKEKSQDGPVGQPEEAHK